MPPEYAVYALKFAGPFDRSRAMVLWMKDWQAVEQINYYIWCVQGGGETVVVDAGVTPRLGRERRLNGYVGPPEVLSRIGVDADAVRHVILTHLHWDHASGVDCFPHATFYVQEAEYRFWVRDPIARRPPFQPLLDRATRDCLAALADAGRLVLLDGDWEVLPGIECLLAPGHTVGLQAVAVDTGRGAAIIGSDCGHLFRNFQEDWPSGIITDLLSWMRSYDKLRARAELEHIFPGHDPLLLDRYPLVAEDVARLA